MKPKTGSIDKTASRRYRVRITLPDGKRKTLNTYATRKDAQRELNAAIEILENETLDGVTVGDFGETVLTKRELSGDIADPGNDWSRWNTHVKNDPLARMPVRLVRNHDIDDFFVRVRRRDIERPTVIAVRQVLRTVFKSAIRRGHITSNPAADIEIPKDTRTEEPWTFATPEEQDALIAAASEGDGAILEFAIGSCLRAGELVSLRLRDVHIEGEDSYVTVRYGGAPDRPTKGRKIRTVPLFEGPRAALRRWLEYLPSFAKKNPHGLVFPGRRGGFRSEEHVFRWAVWQKIIKDAGITRRFRWHDLRHTGASSLISGWWGRSWSLAEVKAILGHASITTTERYAHLADTALKKAARETAMIRPRPISNIRNQNDSQGIPKAKVGSSNLPGGAAFRAGEDGVARRGGGRGRSPKVAESRPGITDWLQSGGVAHAPAPDGAAGSGRLG